MNDRREEPFVVACIPAYNEEKTIARVVLQAQKYVDRVVVCDGGSGDLTGEMINKINGKLCGCGGRWANYG